MGQCKSITDIKLMCKAIWFSFLICTWKKMINIYFIDRAELGPIHDW